MFSYVQKQHMVCIFTLPMFKTKDIVTMLKKKDQKLTHYIHCTKVDLYVLDIGFVNVYDISPLQYLSKTFTCSSKVTLHSIRKCLVKVTFTSLLQYLN